MSALIAVVGCRLKINTEGVVAPVMTIVTSPSTVAFIQQNAVYKGDIIVSIPVATYNESFTASNIFITISPTAEKGTTQGDAPIVKGDKGSLEVTFTGPQGATTVVNVEIEVDDAGQNVVKVN